MDNGNSGPGNMNAANFERSMAEAPQFDPERLPIPDQKENDPGIGMEAGNNPNANTGIYVDPSMLGNTAVNATQFGELNPALGEVVDEGSTAMKRLTEDQISGAHQKDFKISGDGVTEDVVAAVKEIENTKDLFKRFNESNALRREVLGSSYEDRRYYLGGEK